MYFLLLNNIFSFFRGANTSHGGTYFPMWEIIYIFNVVSANGHPTLAGPFDQPPIGFSIFRRIRSKAVTLNTALRQTRRWRSALLFCDAAQWRRLRRDAARTRGGYLAGAIRKEWVGTNLGIPEGRTPNRGWFILGSFQFSFPAEHPEG